MSRILALAPLLALALVTPAFAAEVRSVQAPKRVKAGAKVTVVAAIEDVARCRLQGTAASTAGADRVTFTFTVSRTAKPGRYTLTLRCAGAKTRTLRLTVTRRKGTRGTSRTLIRGKIRATVRRAAIPQPAPTPPCCKPLETPTPTPTATPTPVVPGPGTSFRAVYAVASDQTETPGYVAGITATLDAVNGWFATQTFGNVQPRWMRDAAGAIQVRVVQLPRPKAVYEATDGFAQLREDLETAAPLGAPTQKTVVFTRTGNERNACGINAAGVSWLSQDPCAITPVAPTAWPFDATYVTAHEMTHNFGAVPACAPHSIGGGHVGDDRRDLLFAGAGGRDWDNLTLDPGRDDYYGTGNACGDIAKSPFWTLTADPRS